MVTVMKIKNMKIKSDNIRSHLQLPVLLIALSLLSPPSIAASSSPKLILQITVDQLRGDMITRYSGMGGDRLGKGGLRYLLDKGIVYKNAHHAHANTETIVGHTTLATGAQPSEHGMIGNIWFDRSKGSTIYNIEDPNYRLLSKGADVDSSTEIDPTQKAASSDGRSPASILTTTFSDELSSLTAGKSKVFSVSVKDRGAVSMAGHTGKAFWFSKAGQEFVTSNYYYEKYPQWVIDWNAKKLPEQYAGKAWELMHPQETYLFGDRDDQKWELALGDYGRTFPHKFGASDQKYFSTYLTVSPAGDELTVDFAKAIINAEQLGNDDITDYLSVSLSATDYIGHFFGPSSLESEDNILQLDRTLSDLLRFVDKQVGLKNTLIVLSADHGAPEAPGYLQSLGIKVGYISPDFWSKLPAIEKIKHHHGIKGKLFEGYEHPYIYFSNEVINNDEIDLAALEAAVVDQLIRLPGVSTAVSSIALTQGRLADNYVTRAIKNNYHPKRSGNVYVVFDPGWFVNELDGITVASTHGSPWPYDTFVPVIFAGYKLKPQTVYRKVYTVDVAPTLAGIVGAKPPSGASGTVLPEVFK